MGYIPPFKEKITWVKIDDDIFDVVDLTMQFSIGSHSTTYISFDINKNKNYLNYLTNLYENNIYFTISCVKFISPGSIIKSIYVDNDSSMSISLRCDLLNISNISERRDGIIDDLLNNDNDNESHI